MHTWKLDLPASAHLGASCCVWLPTNSVLALLSSHMLTRIRGEPRAQSHRASLVLFHFNPCLDQAPHVEGCQSVSQQEARLDLGVSPARVLQASAANDLAQDCV